MTIDPSPQVTKGYFELLSPIAPIFDGGAQENISKPYLVFTTANYVPDSNKDAIFFERFKVSIDIITDYKGQKKCDELAQLILNAIIPNRPRTLLVLPDYYIDYTSFDIDTPNRMITLTGVISRKIINFYHDLSPKTL